MITDLENVSSDIAWERNFGDCDKYNASNRDMGVFN